jgi:hypothetical protein
MISLAPHPPTEESVMLAIRLPMLHTHPNRGSQPSVPLGSGVTGTVPRVDRFGGRDHRDDGSAIGGLLVGLGLAILTWVLIIALLTVLL